MSKTKLDELEHLMKLEKAAKDFKTFIELTKPDYQFNWHHQYMIDRFQKLPSQQRQRIIIAMPPRCGKSELVSRRLPAWYLGQNPNCRIITASYSQQLASLFNRDVQRIMEDPIYDEIFPDTVMGGTSAAKVLEDGMGFNKAKRTANMFEVVNKDGYLISIGRGGSITGFGGDLIIADDLIKNADEARSETILDGLWDWYGNTLYSRLEGGANLIICATRWSKRDLTGRLLEDMELFGGEKWEVIEFPALKIGDPTEIDNRKDGESIWPEKYSVEDFEVIKRRSAKDWSSLYQQRPTIIGGSIIKEEWLQFYASLPFDPNKWRSCRMMSSWDLNTKKDGGSYCVGVTIAKHNNNFYLIDIYRGKPSFMEAAEEVKRMAAKYPNATILIEGKANGSAILSYLKKKISRMIEIHPEKDKVERLHACSPIFEAKEFFLPLNHPLTKTISAELTEFPESINDDIVDSITQLLNHFSEMRGISHLRATTKWY